MPVLNAIAGFAPLMKEWRQHLHAHPETGFDCYETAAFVVAQLRSFGVDEIHEGIGQTGVVAIIRGQGEGPVTGLRADMDALPIEEATGLPYASKVAGKMHACGHDGHTTMLLGAAKYLAETRRFSGAVALIFQPAEEGGGGGEVMVREGIMERFNISQVYGIHNGPNIPQGAFYGTDGPFMAAVDTATVHVTGKGGHGAYPQNCIDPVVAIVAMVQALQTIVSRNVPALQEAVVSVTQIHTGSADNIIPDKGWFCATIRSFDPELRKLLRQRFHEIVEGQAAAFGVTVEIDYEWGYPPIINHPQETAFAAAVARDVVGEAQVNMAAPREMGAEDFSYMLEARPGAYFFLGAGEGAGLHHPAFDFNDEIAPIGASYFARLIECRQPLVE